MRRSKMLKKYFKMYLVVMIVILFFACTASAMNLDVGVRGLGGMAAGTTSTSAKTGEIGYEVGGGLNLDFYIVDLGKMSVGLSSGFEYLYLAYTSETTITAPSTVITADVSYSYLKIPLTVKGAYHVSDNIIITCDAGTFFGIFVGGKSDNTYNPEIPLAGLVNGETDLDKDTTNTLDIGLRFAAGVEIGVSENIYLSPGVLFDWGLRDTSKDDPITPSSKDTFWELGAYFGVVYRLF
jgi:hypothetical protein